MRQRMDTCLRKTADMQSSDRKEEQVRFVGVISELYEYRDGVGLRAKYESQELDTTKLSGTGHIHALVAKQYIVPWLSVWLEDNNNWSLDDVMDFSKMKLIKLEVIENAMKQLVSTTPSTDKNILLAWIALLNGLVHHSSKNCNTKEDYELAAVASKHYRSLAEKVMHLANTAGRQAELGRIVKKKVEESKALLPSMKTVVDIWIKSPIRRYLMECLHSLSAKLRKLTQGSSLAVERKEYGRMNDLVLTECHLYGPVRIGAIQNITLRQIRKCVPIWMHPEQDTDPMKLPPEACCHQKNAGEDKVAKMGSLPDGETCCGDAVKPIGFAVVNTKDKGSGNKAVTWIIFHHQVYAQIQELLLIRAAFFSMKEGETDQWWERGKSKKFLTPQGADLREGGTFFRMNQINEAVLGAHNEMLITSNMLRFYMHSVYFHFSKMIVYDKIC
jgi:hypothetical protein